MTCRDALELVEAIAAGDVEVDASARTHFETCPRCASELAAARRIDALLAARDAPGAPARFTASVLARIRRERWRSEQQVDRLFNVAIIAAVVLMVGAVAALMNLNTVIRSAAGAWTLVGTASGHIAQQAAPVVSTYLAAAALLLSALGMWWWAERRLSL